MQIKQFLIIGTQNCVVNFIVFSQTPAASARKLRVTFDNNLNVRQHITQTCRCTILLSLKILKLLLLAVDLTVAILVITILF